MTRSILVERNYSVHSHTTYYRTSVRFGTVFVPSEALQRTKIKLIDVSALKDPSPYFYSALHQDEVYPFRGNSENSR